MPKIFKGMNAKKVTKRRDYRTGKDTLEREDFDGWSTVSEHNIYISMRFSKYKDYIIK